MAIQVHPHPRPDPATITQQVLHANGVDLYCELRGSGPAVLFISGATGDAGHWTPVAARLADEFTVVTFDRRANSRSPRPQSWTTTSLDEQAVDVAALINALDLGPATVFGTSAGAVILLTLLLRHPDVLCGAVVHEPPLLAVLSNADALGADLQALVEDGLRYGGPRGAMELFLRLNAGDETFETLDPELRERMLGNAAVFFSIELEAFISYVPDAAGLVGLPVPVQVVAGIDNRGVYYHEAAAWVARQTGTQLREIPGAHTPYFDRPAELAETLRPLLHAFSR